MSVPRRGLRPRGPGRLRSASDPARSGRDAARGRRRHGRGVGVFTAVLDWLDARTGYRAGLSHLLDEHLPQGTGWAFTSGSILTFLLGIQFVTGIVLAMYYVASPTLAY